MGYKFKPGTWGNAEAMVIIKRNILPDFSDFITYLITLAFTKDNTYTNAHYCQLRDLKLQVILFFKLVGQPIPFALCHS